MLLNGLTVIVRFVVSGASYLMVGVNSAALVTEDELPLLHPQYHDGEVVEYTAAHSNAHVYDVADIMCLNPVTPVIETFKYGALSAGEFVGWRWLLYSFVFMIFLLAGGIVIFNKVQKSFMDTV